jgi:putative ABC transport system ATP-binding protein
VSAGSLRAENLSMHFGGESGALFDIDLLELPSAGSLGVCGPSGAGKTTLFNCLAGIEALSGGQVFWDGVNIGALTETRRDGWRHKSLGLVFQDFHLIDGLSAIDNVLLPASFDAWRPAEALRRRAAMLLDRVGIAAPRRLAAFLSRGERQRVAIARALLFAPPVVMADEPTASLDPDHRRAISDLLVEVVSETGASLLVISHEQELLARMNRRLELRDGRLHES